MDGLWTYIGKKSKRRYVWASIAVTQTGKYFYFYHLSKSRDAGSLFTFDFDLPKVNKIYTDGCFSYNKISYLVRRTKAHAKSFNWLDNRLALFFVNKNLGI